jgi:pentapeptide repeat protein
MVNRLLRNLYWMTAPFCSLGLLVVALKGLSPWIRYPLALVLSMPLTFVAPGIFWFLVEACLWGSSFVWRLATARGGEDQVRAEKLTPRPKISDLTGWLCAMPGVLWPQFVQAPRTCRMIKHAGRGIDLQRVLLLRVSLPGVCLEGANLSRAYLLMVDLHGADLSNANLSYASLHSSNLQGANLRGANLLGAGLAGTDLQDADLTGADLTGSSLLRPDCHVPAEWLGELTPEPRREMGFVCPNLTGQI